MGQVWEVWEVWEVSVLFSFTYTYTRARRANAAPRTLTCNGWDLITTANQLNTLALEDFPEAAAHVNMAVGAEEDALLL